MIFKNIFAKKWRKNWLFLFKIVQVFQNFEPNIGLNEKRHFFRRKMAKSAENCDHSIDSWA
jgi:hypothetical protein